MKSICVSTLACAGLAVCLGFALPAAFYEKTDLLSDGAVPARVISLDVVNPWGLASSPTGPFWIANEGTGTSSIVEQNGQEAAPSVAVPADHTGHPTGLVFNKSGEFKVSANGNTAPSVFLFVTLEGRIMGWSPQVDPSTAVVAVDNQGRKATYTGATMAEDHRHFFLYVANFATGNVDVFNAKFEQVGTMTDKHVPTNFSPFGIANVDGLVYVTYVPRDPNTGDEVAGPGHGLIDAFSADGTKVTRIASFDQLNAPWGMVRAPDGFGPFTHKLLVGNFGDGRILAYDDLGHFSGALADENGAPIVIEGIWGLLFGNGGQGGEVNDLYFTAGIKDEQHGVFGEIEFAQ